MGSDKSDVIQALKAGGFKMVSCNKHEVWSNGSIEVRLPKGSKVSPMCARGIISRARKSENTRQTFINGGGK